MRKLLLSFHLSFHQGLLGPTGAHWLDDPSDVTCKDSTQQYSVDDPLLSCNLLPMPGAPYYAEAFFLLPGRCFRMVTRQSGGAGPTHCPEPVA